MALIQPPDTLVQEFVTAVAGNQNLLADLNLLIRYLHKTRQTIDWNAIMEACSNAVSNPVIASQGNIYLILLELAVISQDLSQRVANTVRDQKFYLALRNPVHPAAAFVWSIFTQKEFPVFPPPRQELIQNVNRMRNFWLNENEQNASAIISYHEKYGFWPEFWQLTKRGEWQLVRGIIRKLVDSESLGYSLKSASIQDVFENLQFRDADIIEKLVRGFYDHCDLEVKLLALKDIKVPFLTDVLPYVQEMDISDKLRGHLRPA